MIEFCTIRGQKALLATIFATALFTFSACSDGGDDQKSQPTESEEVTKVDDVRARRAEQLVEEARELSGSGEYKAALDRFEEALELDPENEEAIAGVKLRIVSPEDAAKARQKVNHGVNLAFVGKFLEAFRAFGEARALDPNDRDIRFKEANAALECRRYHTAMDLYEDLLAEDPTSPKARVNGALAAHRAADYPRCLKFLDSIEDLVARAEGDPQLAELLPRIWFLRGIAADKAHRTPEAIDGLRRASRLQPDDAQFHRHLGLVYLEDGKFELAIQEFQDALKIQAADPISLHNLGRCHEKLGAFEKAIPWFKQALALDNTLFMTAVRIARCYQAIGGRQNLLQALGYVQRAKEINPLSHEALHTLQGIHRLLGNAELSKRHLATYNRIKAYSKDQEEKLRDLNAAIRKNPKDTKAYLAAIDILTDFTHWKDAMAKVRELLNAEPTNFDGLWHMARLLLVDKDYNGAYFEAAKMVDVKPDDSRGYTLQAICLHHLGRVDEGLLLARKAFGLDASDLGALQILLILLEKAGGRQAEIAQLTPLYQRLNAQEEAKLEQLRKRDESLRSKLIDGPDGN